MLRDTNDDSDNRMHPTMQQQFWESHFLSQHGKIIIHKARKYVEKERLAQHLWDELERRLQARPCTQHLYSISLVLLWLNGSKIVGKTIGSKIL